VRRQDLPRLALYRRLCRRLQWLRVRPPRSAQPPSLYYSAGITWWRIRAVPSRPSAKSVPGLLERCFGPSFQRRRLATGCLSIHLVCRWLARWEVQPVRVFHLPLIKQVFDCSNLPALDRGRSRMRLPLALPLPRACRTSAGPASSIAPKWCATMVTGRLTEVVFTTLDCYTQILCLCLLPDKRALRSSSFCRRRVTMSGVLEHSFARLIVDLCVVGVVLARSIT
jgi:hypothetical protein